MDRALGAKFFKFGMVAGMGIRVSKTIANKLWSISRRSSCVKFKMAASVNVRAHSFTHNKRKNLCNICLPSEII